MPRKTLLPTEPASSGVVLHPQAVYSRDEARQLLRLRESSLRREIREGRLRVFKRCGRYFISGEQLLAWLQGGLVSVKPVAHTNNGN